MAYQSRAARLATAIAAIEATKSELESIKEEVDSLDDLEENDETEAFIADAVEHGELKVPETIEKVLPPAVTDLLTKSTTDQQEVEVDLMEHLTTDLKKMSQEVSGVPALIQEVEIPKTELQLLSERAVDSLNLLDFSEVETLRDEIENWKSGLEGTNLENSSKYETLSSTFDCLDSAVSSLENINSSFSEDDKEELSNDLDSSINEIDSALSELENAEFPGMYS
jgi:prefoldin subunit 5